MVGLIAFANNGGLGIQTKRLYEMLKPEKVLLIDSRGFSKNKEFHSEWYPGAYITDGFPRNYDIKEWIQGLDTVFTVENPYNFYLVWKCREMGIKTVCQTNYEFCENLTATWLPVPDLFLMPSYWKLGEMQERFGYEKVIYLPPPIDPKEFEEARELNFRKKGRPRFLHIVGTLAAGDRNGTLDLLKAIPLTKRNMEIVIHSQHPLPPEYIISDKRVTYRIKNYERNSQIYHNFDGLILPRRYGGLSLTTNEALMAGLPVMMTDVSPNDEWLPKKYLVPAIKTGEIQVRVKLDSYSADIEKLAERIDKWALKPLSSRQAFSLAEKTFSPEHLSSRYRTLL